MSATLDESLLISGFELLTKLSSGGMGDVLLARRRGVHGFEKLVAIKTIRGELAKRSDIRAMFLDEARLSARLDHPNIAQVYDFGEENETLFLAMEYVPGIALNKLLAKRGAPLPPAVAMRIIAEVCRGLHAAHELTDHEGTLLGVVHRDVSPGNLILTFDGRMKILDFGIAFMRNRESPDTVVGELKGKPSYMAPEHLRAQGVDRRADIYSASVVLHELLTGRKLFTRETVVATVLAVESQPVPTPSEIAGPLPSGLDEIVMRGLERKPVDRFPDARSMATALDRLAAEVGGESIEMFVESEMSFEREQHRQWLHSVLSGHEGGFPSAKTPAGGTGAVKPRAVALLDQKGKEAPSVPSRPGVAAAPLPSISGGGGATPLAPVAIEAGVNPLVEHTTLVPPGMDASQPVHALPYRSSTSMFALAGIVALCFAAALIGYRVLFQDAVVVVSVPEKAPERVQAVLTPPAPEPVAAVEPPPVPTATKTAVAEQAAVEEDEEPVESPQRRTRANPGRRARQRVEKQEPKRDREPERAVQPEGFGFVTIGAQPYALVRIDGQEVGVTPIMRKKLPAGPHEIQLVSPDSGAVRLKKSVTLADGEHQRITLP